METLCPSVQSSGEAARDELTVGGILRAFLPLLLHLLKLSGHKLRVLWQLAACGTSAWHIDRFVLATKGDIFFTNRFVTHN